MCILGHSEFIPVFLGKIGRKIQNGHFWLFQIYTSLLGKSCQKKFGATTFGNSKFIPVFLGKIVRKIQNGHFGHSAFIPVFLGKIFPKSLEQSFLAF